MSLHLSSRPFTTADEERQHRQTLQDIATLNARLLHASGAIKDETVWRGLPALQPLCRPELRTIFPPLATFAHTWGIRLPLDPRIPALPEWIAASVFPRSYDIRVTYRRVWEDLNLWPQHDVELVVEFSIRSGASPDELREQFELILARQAFLHQPRAGRIRHDQAYFKRVFQAYKLRQQGQTLSAIAYHLWPADDWERQTTTQKTLVQRVRAY